MPDREDDRPIFHWVVPEEGRDHWETPDEYLVVRNPQAAAGCVIYGKFTAHRTDPEWIANIATRSLILHLLTVMAAARDAVAGWGDGESVHDLPLHNRGIAALARLLAHSGGA